MRPNAFSGAEYFCGVTEWSVFVYVQSIAAAGPQRAPARRGGEEAHREHEGRHASQGAGRVLRDAEERRGPGGVRARPSQGERSRSE